MANKLSDKNPWEKERKENNAVFMAFLLFLALIIGMICGAAV